MPSLTTPLYWQKIVYTPMGRAWNYQSPTLGGTANVAFLSLVYAKFLMAQNEYVQLAKRYVCWSRGQIRYMLGGAGQSLVVGFGVDPPSRVQNEAASCQPAPASCNKVLPLNSLAFAEQAAESSLVWTHIQICSCMLPVQEHKQDTVHGQGAWRLQVKAGAKLEGPQLL